MICLALIFLARAAPSPGQGREHSKAASTADTVGKAPQSHSVGVGPPFVLTPGPVSSAQELVECSVLVGVLFRTGSR